MDSSPGAAPVTSSAAAANRVLAPSTPSASRGDNGVSTTSQVTPLTTNKASAIPTAAKNELNSVSSKQRESLSTALENGLEELLLGSDFARNRFDHYYTLTKKLMSGSYGTVFVGVHNLTKKEFAVKVIDRRSVIRNYIISWYYSACCIVRTCNRF